MQQRHLLWIALLSACQPEPQRPAASAPISVPALPTTSAPAPIAPPSASASAPASASALARPAEVPSFPVPPTPPGADPEKVLIATSICPAGYRTEQVAPGKPPRTAVGCRAHPPFDVPSRYPDGSFAEFTGDWQKFCQITNVQHGSFRRPGAKEALVTFEQCMDNDSDVWDAAMPGSAVVVEETNGRWKSVADAPGVNLGFCETIRWQDGHDALVCWSGFGAPPSPTMWYLFLLDFARPAPHAGTFMRIYNHEFSCAWGTGSLAENGFAALKGFKRTFRDLNGDGVRDVVLELERARVAPSSKLEARVQSLCATNPRITQSAFMPPFKAFRLEFVSQGRGFVPTAATRKLVEQWEKETPDQGVKGASPPTLE